MRDLDNVNSQGVAKSRGYAFVNFTEHAHALAALRGTNNNADVFGENRVCFSVSLCQSFRRTSGNREFVARSAGICLVSESVFTRLD